MLKNGADFTEAISFMELNNKKVTVTFSLTIQYFPNNSLTVLFRNSQLDSESQDMKSQF